MFPQVPSDLVICAPPAEKELLPDKVCVPVPALTKLSEVGPADTPVLDIVPLKIPSPLSFPIDSVSDYPPPPSEKSTIPVPVRVPTLIVVPSAP
jgi:hypothetical protein